MIDESIQVWTGQDVKAAPGVSVIIPAYNVAPYIAEALDSVFAQTFTDYEVIVINDGSPDTGELERILELYRERIVYAKQENRGVSGARNTGLRTSRAPFIALLDSDDVWFPHFLAVQMETIKNDSTIDVLYSNAIIFGDMTDAGREMMDLSPSEGEVTFERLVLQKCNIFASSVIARREIIFRAGMFDESLRSCEDFDLWLRILKKGGHITYHRQVLFRYQRRCGSLSSNPIWMCNHILQVLAKAERTLELTESERQSLLQCRNHFQAALRLSEGKSAFFNGDAKTAIKNLTEANAFFRSRKIAVLVRLLRVAPRFLLWMYNARDRFVFRANTKLE